MSEPATLEEIRYEPVVNDAGERIGWAPATADRRRFEQGSRYPGTGTHAVRPTEPDEAQARPIDAIVADLEQWGIGDPRLYAQLGELHAEKPLVADRIAGAAVNGARNATLHDPSAFLASRLRPRK